MSGIGYLLRRKKIKAIRGTAFRWIWTLYGLECARDVWKTPPTDQQCSDFLRGCPLTIDRELTLVCKTRRRHGVINTA